MYFGCHSSIIHASVDTHLDIQASVSIQGHSTIDIRWIWISTNRYQCFYGYQYSIIHVFMDIHWDIHWFLWIYMHELAIWILNPFFWGDSCWYILLNLYLSLVEIVLNSQKRYSYYGFADSCSVFPSFAEMPSLIKGCGGCRCRDRWQRRSEVWDCLSKYKECSSPVHPVAKRLMIC